MIRFFLFPILVPFAASASAGPNTASSGAPLVSNDYAECARLLNNFESTPENKRGYRINDYGSQSKDRLRYLPFRVESDGAISPFPDTQTSCDRASRTCTYSYKTPPLQDLEDIDNKERVNALVTAEHPDLLETETVVTRDAKGDIIEIFEALPPNQNALAGERRYSSIKGVRTTLGIRNNTCVPMRSSEVFARAMEEDGQTVLIETELPVFITPLCRDLQEVLEANDALFSGFDLTVGEELKTTFVKYRSEMLLDGPRPFFSREELEEEVGWRLNVKHDFHGPLNVQALLGYYADGAPSEDRNTNAVSTMERMQRLGQSPVLSSQKILSHCYYRGLRNTLRNDSLWQ